MLYFILGVLFGGGFLLALYLTARSEYAQQLIRIERIIKEKAILLNFMHSLYNGISHRLSNDTIFQRIIYGSRMTTFGISARFFKYEPKTQELIPSVKEGAFPLLKTKFPRGLSRTEFLSTLNKGETFSIGEGFIGKCARNLKTHILDGDELSFLIKNSEFKMKVKRLLLCPVVFKDELFGVVAIANPMQPNGFSHEVCALLQSICEQAGIVLNNVRQLEQLFETQKVQFDLEVANHVQMYLLPKIEKMHIDSVEMYIQYKPSQKIGGDLYDTIALDKYRTFVVIGDVSGHGISAALIMAKTLSHLKHFVLLAQHPSVVLKNLNDMLYRTIPEHLFVTMVSAIIDTQNNTIEVARAGHEYPFLIHNKKIMKLKGSGMALGLMPREVFDETVEDIIYSFLPGDTCILFTDGLMESRNFQGIEFSDSFEQSIFRHIDKPVKSMNESIVQDLQTFLQGSEVSDDLTLITLRHL